MRQNPLVNFMVFLKGAGVVGDGWEEAVARRLDRTQHAGRRFLVHRA
jgi:hypothetical protein